MRGQLQPGTPKVCSSVALSSPAATSSQGHMCCDHVLQGLPGRSPQGRWGEDLGGHWAGHRQKWASLFDHPCCPAPASLMSHEMLGEVSRAQRAVSKAGTEWVVCCLRTWGIEGPGEAGTEGLRLCIFRQDPVGVETVRQGAQDGHQPKIGVHTSHGPGSASSPGPARPPRSPSPALSSPWALHSVTRGPLSIPAMCHLLNSNDTGESSPQQSQGQGLAQPSSFHQPPSFPAGSHTRRAHKKDSEGHKVGWVQWCTP